MIDLLWTARTGEEELTLGFRWSEAFELAYPLDLRWLLRAFIALSKAVGAMHQSGNLHADLKPEAIRWAEDPEALRAELNARIESVRGPVGPLSRFEIEEMIDPRDTRRLICEWLPTAFRLVNLPSALVPRDLGFRP